MKKTISLIVILAFCLSFTACGGNNGGQEQQGEYGTSEAIVSTTLNRSMYDEICGCFTNSYTQLTVTPPGDWYIYSDNDLAMAYLEGRVTGDEFAMWGAADFKNKTVIPDFAFQDMANSNNLSVVYVNLDNVENEVSTDEKAFHGLVIQNMSEQGRALNQTDDEIITIADKEFYMFRFKNSDTNWYMAMRKQDNYMIVITATDRTDTGKEMFLGFIS